MKTHRESRGLQRTTEADLPDASGEQFDAMASSCSDAKGRVPEMARPLRLQCSDCEELLHELSNIVTGVVMHAQMLEWKLPPYSHLKRSVREIGRNAQRGSELLKRIVRRLDNGEAMTGPQDIAVACGNSDSLGNEGRRPHRRW